MRRGRHRPATYFHYGSVWHVDAGVSGVVAIEPIEVILQVLLVAGKLQEPALVAGGHCPLEKLAKALAHSIVVSMREPFKPPNNSLRSDLKAIKWKGGAANTFIILRDLG